MDRIDMPVSDPVLEGKVHVNGPTFAVKRRTLLTGLTYVFCPTCATANHMTGQDPGAMGRGWPQGAKTGNTAVNRVCRTLQSILSKSERQTTATECPV